MKNRKISVLLIIIMFLSNFSNILALSKDFEVSTPLKLDDGDYKIENSTIKKDSEEESISRKYLDKNSKVKIQDGKVYISLKFLEKNVINNISFKIKEDIVKPNSMNENGDTIEFEMAIKDFSDIILVNADITIPILQKTMNVDFRVLLNEDTLVDSNGNKVTIKDIPNEEETSNDKDENEVIPDKGEVNDSEADKNQINNSYKDGMYKVKNKILTNSQIGYQAARGSLNSINYIEIKNGQTYVTLGFGQTNLMSNIRVLINNKVVNYEVVKKDSSKHTMDIKFKMPSITSSIDIKAYIPMIEQDISFGVTFIEDSMQSISPSQANETLGISKGNSSIVEINNLMEQSLEDKNNNESKNNNQTNYVKRYSIKNEVIHNSSIGRKMARKYLNDTTYIEDDVHGNKYVIISLSGTNVMNNIKIKINEKEVKYEVINTSDNEKSFKFKVDDISDKIQVYMFIKPVKMNIDFEIKLLDHTLTLIDEKSVNSTEELISNNMKLTTEKQNLSMYPIKLIVTIVVSLVLVISIGIFYKRKKYKK